MGEILGLQVAVGAVAVFRPAHKQQRRAVPAVGVRIVVRQRRHRVGPPVAAAERRRPSVDALVAAQGGLIVAQRRRSDSFTTLPKMNPMLAGRSARRRMR